MGSRKLKIGAVIAAAGLGVLIASVALSGIRFNFTESYPRGFWRIADGQPASRGSLVIACPPAEIARHALSRGYLGHGACSGGVQPLLKRIVAVPGDDVAVTDDGVTVNGRHIDNSMPKATDPGGRAMQRAENQHIQAGMVFLMSDMNPDSYDSRYFGPVPIRSIQGTATPLYLIDDVPEGL